MILAIWNPQPVTDFLQTEVKAGWVIGPLPDIPDVQINRFSAIPKQGQPGKWQLILDHSSPHSLSMNDGVAQDLCSMRYATVDNAIEKVLRLGMDSKLWSNMRIETSRYIPAILDYWVWCVGDLYIDTVLPFKVCIKSFSAIADTIKWMALHTGVSILLHYLDSFVGKARQNANTTLIYWYSYAVDLV